MEPQTPHVPLALIAGLSLLIVWRLVVRSRRLIARQAFKPWRARLTATLFPLLALALGVGALTVQPRQALWLLAGFVLGGALALRSLRLTLFEETPAGLFFTPEPRIGILLAVLLVGRVGWRLTQFFLVPAELADPPTAFFHSPATLLIFGTLAGHYAAYAAGLLRRLRVQRAR